MLCWVESLSHVLFFATPWTLACQAPLSMGSLQARMLYFHAFINASTTGLQSQSSQCGTPRSRQPCGAQTLVPCRDFCNVIIDFCNVIILSLVSQGRVCPSMWVLFILSPPLLPVSPWFLLYAFSCGKYFLLVLGHFHRQLL